MYGVSKKQICYGYQKYTSPERIWKLTGQFDDEEYPGRIFQMQT